MCFLYTSDTTYNCDRFLFNFQLRSLRLKRLRVHRWIENVASIDRRATDVHGFETLHRMIQPSFLERIIVKPG